MVFKNDYIRNIILTLNNMKKIILSAFAIAVSGILTVNAHQVPKKEKRNEEKKEAKKDLKEKKKEVRKDKKADRKPDKANN